MTVSPPSPQNQGGQAPDPNAVAPAQAGTSAAASNHPSGNQGNQGGQGMGQGQGATSAANATAISQKTFKPNEPKMGGLEEIGPDTFVPWTGGKPKPGWVGLVLPQPESIEPTQYRPTSVGSAAKSQSYRIRGLEAKFSKADELLEFQQDVEEHLVSYGMDSISYLADPQQSGEMISVITNHAKFDPSAVQLLEMAQKRQYDSYDKANIRDAKKFLVESIERTVKVSLTTMVNKDTCTFIEMWMAFILLVRPTSVREYEKVKTRMLSVNIKSYARECVESMCEDLLKDYSQLIGAGMYDHTMTPSILDNIMEGGGTSNEDFRETIRNTRKKAEQEYMKVRHQNYQDQMKHMIGKQLDLKAALSQAMVSYRDVKSRGKWPAAMNATDSKAINKNYGGSVNAAVIEKAVNQLKQMIGNSDRDKSKDTCNSCGEVGHWSRECPKKGKRIGNSGGFKQKGQGRGWTNPKKSKDHRSNARVKSPGKLPAPKEGESEIKMHEGTKLYYCKRCSRWNKTHSTSSHKSKEEMNGGRSAGMARVNFDLHPAAFKLIVPKDPYEKYHVPPSDNKAKTMSEILSMVCKLWWIIMSAVILCELVSKVYTMETLTNVAKNFTHAMCELWKQHGLTTLIGALSGMVSSVCMHEVLKQTKDVPGGSSKPVRYRLGENYIKKYHRYVSKSGNKNRNTDSYQEALKHARANGMCVKVADKYQNVSRPGRSEPPEHVKERFIKYSKDINTAMNSIRKYMELVQDLDSKRHILATNRKYLYAHGSKQLVQNQLISLQFALKQRKRTQNGGKSLTLSNLYELTTIKNAKGKTRIVMAGKITGQSPKVKTRENDEVLFDSGANCCITFVRGDFVGEFKELSGPMVDGIGKGIKIEGKGHVAWTFLDDNLQMRTLKLPCYFVPSITSRIASIGELLKAYPDEEIRITPDSLIVSGSKANGTSKITIRFSKKTELPTAELQTTVPRSQPSAWKVARKLSENVTNPFKKLPGSASLTEGVNFNLAEPEKELLRWHYRLGHVGMRRVQWLFRQGALSSSERSRRLHSAAAKLVSGPLCTGCQYAKQRRKTTPGSAKVATEPRSLKGDKVFPGQMVSADHFNSNPHGRLLHTYGKEADDRKFVGGCIFVDSASGLVHVELQTNLNSHQTLQSTLEFEKMAHKHGVVIQSYLSDNGTAFRNQAYLEHLKQFHQVRSYSAVGAHHSNGIAERNIGHVLSIARAMLHHAALHWPDTANAELWPLAVLHAVYVLNRIPKTDSGLSPYELFTRKTWPRRKLQDLHVWGCPAYVLDSTLADEKKIPRWKPRCGRSMYVGHSALHASSIPLVLNLDTGHISPSYHVVFDDWFQTVGTSIEELPNFEHDEWYNMFGATEWQYIKEDDDDVLPTPNQSEVETATHRDNVLDALHPIAPTPLAQQEPTPLNQRENPIQRENDPVTIELPSATNDHAPNHHALPPQQSKQLNTEPSPPTYKEAVLEERTTHEPAAPTLQVKETPPAMNHGAPPQREKSQTDKVVETKPISQSSSPTVRRPTTRSQTGPRRSPRLSANAVTYNECEHWSNVLDAYTSRDLSEAYLQVDIQPTAYKAKAQKDPDTLSWDDAMDSEYRDQFIESARIEIDALTAQGTWVEDHRSNATNKIIPSQWVFRIKRSPDGEIKKFKGRCVLRGDMQNYVGETYSPVAAWSTVRIMLIMCMRLNWVTLCIDFSNAFVQSPLPESEPVWMHPPRGFASSKGKDYVLKLKKSLYGHCVAPKLWFEYSTKAFKELGLKQSAHDECLWFTDNMILVQYVDDCAIGAPNREVIDKFVEDLRKKGFQLTQEDSLAEFLGIKFETLSDGAFKLTQRGLISKILQTANMTDCNPNALPAAMTTLGADKDGEPFQEDWNYRAIVGMLLYLSTNTRVDIAFAVSQVARFGSDPKASHGKAVKTLLRYLKKTQDEGMTLRPTKAFMLHNYCDSDFAGMFGQEHERDPNVARSRMGYVMTLCGCPLIWKSSLAKCITQSTTEAEYYALTTSMRVFLPLKEIVEEVVQEMGSTELEGAVVQATVFEDNQAAYYLATNQRITSRTRYFLAKWHWFWEAYNEGLFQIVKCPTDEQQSDYLTKMLAREGFERNRMQLQGWKCVAPLDISEYEIVEEQDLEFELMESEDIALLESENSDCESATEIADWIHAGPVLSQRNTTDPDWTLIERIGASHTKFGLNQSKPIVTMATQREEMDSNNDNSTECQNTTTNEPLSVATKSIDKQNRLEAQQLATQQQQASQQKGTMSDSEYDDRSAASRSSGWNEEHEAPTPTKDKEREVYDKITKIFYKEDPFNMSASDEYPVEVKTFNGKKNSTPYGFFVHKPLVNQSPTKTVIMNANGNYTYFNEPQNAYGRRVVTVCMKLYLEADKKGRLPAGKDATKGATTTLHLARKDTVDLVYKMELEAYKTVFNQEIGTPGRRNMLFYQILVDFNNEEPRNRELSHIAAEFIKYRIGENFTELGILECAREEIIKALVEKATKTNGINNKMARIGLEWTYPILLLLDGHLKHHKVPGINVPHSPAEFDSVEDKNKKRDKIFKYRTKRYVKESSSDVIAKYEKYLQEYEAYYDPEYGFEDGNDNDEPGDDDDNDGGGKPKANATPSSRRKTKSPPAASRPNTRGSSTKKAKRN